MLGTGITRLLPKSIRDTLIRLSNDYHFGSSTIKFKPVRERRAFQGKRVVIAGLFSVQCGLQRAADLMALDLEAQGIPVFRMDVAKVLSLASDLQRSDTGTLRDIEAFQPTDIVVHVAPPLFNRFLSKLGRTHYYRASIIAFWHWELDKAPPEWAQALAWCDEIWAPTPFVATAINAILTAKRDIKVVKNAVERDPFSLITPPERETARRALEISLESCVVGFTFSMASSFWRKNPLAVIEAFQKAFPGVDNARLILRCHDCDRYRQGYDLLKIAVEKDKRIILIDGKYSRIALKDFYATLDVFVSLHRAEGYGLTLAEAMQCGLKVVATGWGLAPELASNEKLHTVSSNIVSIVDPQGLYSDNKEAQWAEPNTDAAASILRFLFLPQIS